MPTHYPDYVPLAEGPTVCVYVVTLKPLFLF